MFASSGATIRGWDQVPPYDAITSGRYQDVPKNWPIITHETARPIGLYGATKVWGETLGSHFSDAYGLSILCVRVGFVPADDRPHNIREFTAYLSHRDVVDVFHRCIEAPDSLLYDIFFATSNNKWGYRDLDHVRQVLGYVPQDSAESFS